MIAVFRPLAIALLCVTVVPSAMAQIAQPFDMSGERGNAPPAMPDTPPVAPTYAPAPQTFAPRVMAPAAPAVQAAPPMAAPTVAAPTPAAPSDPAPAAATQPAAAPAADAAVAPAPRFSVPIMVPSMRAPLSPSLPSLPSVSIIAPATPSAGSGSGGGRLSRFIIPERSLRLEGETAQRAWSVYLTADEAARTASIDIAYKNAIVVMPEASRLRIVLNDAVVLETPLASSDKFKSVSSDIPAGVLRPGANVIRFQAYQRHRTDCSIQSTYELWTDIDPAGSRLQFEGDGQTDILQSLEDLPAVGYGADGVTGIHFVIPAATQGAAAENVIKLSQAIALLGGYPNPATRISDKVEKPDPRGTLTVLMGDATETGKLLSSPIASATSQPVVSFVEEPQLGASVLVITGSNWGQVSAAVDAIAARADQPANTPRQVLNTASWLAPDVHLFSGQENIAISRLGITTQQFSGRRFRSEFAVGIPSDFYAESYGEASLLLDAAYTSAVLPASHVDIYVNGQIAATTRITNRTGGIFRHLPIQIPFRHFRPGVNDIMLEAVLNTDADQACVPGGSIAGSDRFVLFDTTEFSMPAFARIARRPNLAAFSGTAFPYGSMTANSALVLGRPDLDTLTAAGTLVGRLAIQAARILPLALTSAANVGDQPAIFVGVASQFSDGTLSRLGIAETVRTNWKSEAQRPPEPVGGAVTTAGSDLPDSAAVPGADQENTDAVFDRWRTALAGGGGWRGQVSSFEDWMKRNFDISFSALRIGPAAEVAFEPKARSTMLFAQAVSPGGSGTWTMMTAPSTSDLASGATSIVEIQTWSRIGGQFSSFSGATGLVENQAAENYQFVVTEPLSLQNLRLIAANWFSSNIAFYAFSLIGLCIVLGIITSGLLLRLGRPS